MRQMSRSDFRAMTGREIGVSGWIEITQERIDQFAECTGDRQFIHVDGERARQTPFGTTIAHGFLTLSLISQMNQDMPRMEGAIMRVNYGLNRMRLVSPVPVGSRIRGRFVLAKFEEIGPREVQTTLNVTVEIEAKEKPALVAEWLIRRYFGSQG